MFSEVSDITFAFVVAVVWFGVCNTGAKRLKLLYNIS